MRREQGRAIQGGLERTFLENLQSSSVSRMTRGSSPLQGQGRISSASQVKKKNSEANTGFATILPTVVGLRVNRGRSYGAEFVDANPLYIPTS